ncbi:hypothetical protein HNO52_05015 [Billgrantia diversa]|nr:hypothetical protein HNO52_05015 [Halomonas sp. MCCC 1A13316]
MGFPVWYTQVSSIHPDKCGHGRVNAPIVCDGVTMNPGGALSLTEMVTCACRSNTPTRWWTLLSTVPKRRTKPSRRLIANGTSLGELSGAAASSAGTINELDQVFDDGALRGEPLMTGGVSHENNAAGGRGAYQRHRCIGSWPAWWHWV